MQYNILGETWEIVNAGSRLKNQRLNILLWCIQLLCRLHIRCTFLLTAESIVFLESFKIRSLTSKLKQASAIVFLGIPEMKDFLSFSSSDIVTRMDQKYSFHFMKKMNSHFRNFIQNEKESRCCSIWGALRQQATLDNFNLQRKWCSEQEKSDTWQRDESFWCKSKMTFEDRKIVTWYQTSTLSSKHTSRFPQQLKMHHDFWMVNANFDIIKIKHHVGYILPDVTNDHQSFQLRHPSRLQFFLHFCQMFFQLVSFQEDTSELAHDNINVCKIFKSWTSSSPASVRRKKNEILLTGSQDIEILCWWPRSITFFFLNK